VTLTDFLLARIAEDEAPTYELVPYGCPQGCCAPAGWVGSRCLICGTGPEYGGTAEAITATCQEHEERVHRRSRVLAECAAKRAIVDSRATFERGRSAEREIGMKLTMGGCVAGIDVALKFLALPYADHPDYDEAWRP